MQDEAHQSLMMQELNEAGGDFWIGLTDVDHDDTFVWSHSGVELKDFSSWSPGQPDGNGTQSCVSMTKEHFYFWTDDDCNNARRQPACFQSVLLNRCGRSDAFFVEQTERCYVPYEADITFDAAITLCNAAGGNAYLVMEHHMNLPTKANNTSTV